MKNISGTVTRVTNSGTAAVTLGLSLTGTGAYAGQNYSVTSGANGTYSINVGSSWAGTISITDAATWSLSPASRTVTSGSGNLTAQNFTASRYYYVAKTGSDSNLGTGTAGDELLTIQKGVSLAKPGDTITVKPGTYAETVKFTGANTGVSGSPITLKSQSWYSGIAHAGALDVTIDGTLTATTRRTLGLQIYGTQQYITVRGVKIYNAQTGISIGNCAHVTLEDCQSDSAYGTGISIGGTSATTIDVTLTRCICSNAGDIGISWNNGSATTYGPTDCLAVDCDSYLNGWRVTEHGNGFRVTGRENTALARKAARIIIRNCIARDNYSSSFSHNDARDMTVEDCIGYGTHTGGDGDGRGFIIGIHATADSGYAIIRRCVSFDNPTQGMPIAGAPYTSVYHCTIFDNGFQRAGENLPTNCSGVQLGTNNTQYLNNAAFDSHSDAIPTSVDWDRGSQTGIRSDYNCIKDGNDLGLEDGHSFSGDPQITDKATARSLALQYSAGTIARAAFLTQIADALRPAPGSPLINAGGFLTTTSASGVLTSLVPTNHDPRLYFRAGDTIRVGSNTTIVVSMTSSSITVTNTISFSSGDGVHTPYTGSAPTIGAFE